MPLHIKDGRFKLPHIYRANNSQLNIDYPLSGSPTSEPCSQPLILTYRRKDRPETVYKVCHHLGSLKYRQ